MDENQEDVSVACFVSGRHFGQSARLPVKVLVVGTLIHARAPYDLDDGGFSDGWPDHFHSLNAYSEIDKKLYPLRIKSQEGYRACEMAAILTLRAHGHLEDADEEILSRYA